MINSTLALDRLQDEQVLAGARAHLKDFLSVVRGKLGILMGRSRAEQKFPKLELWFAREAGLLKLRLRCEKPELTLRLVTALTWDS